MRVTALVVLCSISTLCNAENVLVAQGVCDAAMKPQASRAVTLRGAGKVVSPFQEILLIDRSCAEGGASPEKEEQWGAIVVKLTPSTIRESVFARFASKIESRELARFQAVIEGHLTCRKIERSVNSTSGKGFGSWGLIPCEITVHKMLRFVEVF